VRCFRNCPFRPIAGHDAKSYGAVSLKRLKIDSINLFYQLGVCREYISTSFDLALEVH
jgi:hypothetical protein